MICFDGFVEEVELRKKADKVIHKMADDGFRVNWHESGIFTICVDIDDIEGLKEVEKFIDDFATGAVDVRVLRVPSGNTINETLVEAAKTLLDTVRELRNSGDDSDMRPYYVKVVGLDSDGTKHEFSGTIPMSGAEYAAWEGAVELSFNLVLNDKALDRVVYVEAKEEEE